MAVYARRSSEARERAYREFATDALALASRIRDRVGSGPAAPLSAPEWLERPAPVIPLRNVGIAKVVRAEVNGGELRRAASPPAVDDRGRGRGSVIAVVATTTALVRDGAERRTAGDAVPGARPRREAAPPIASSTAARCDRRTTRPRRGERRPRRCARRPRRRRAPRRRGRAPSRRRRWRRLAAGPRRRRPPGTRGAGPGPAAGRRARAAAAADPGPAADARRADRERDRPRSADGRAGRSRAQALSTGGRRQPEGGGGRHQLDPVAARRDRERPPRPPQLARLGDLVTGRGDALAARPGSRRRPPRHARGPGRWPPRCGSGGSGCPPRSSQVT